MRTLRRQSPRFKRFVPSRACAFAQNCGVQQFRPHAGVPDVAGGASATDVRALYVPRARNRSACSRRVSAPGAGSAGRHAGFRTLPVARRARRCARRRDLATAGLGALISGAAGFASVGSRTRVLRASRARTRSACRRRDSVARGAGRTPVCRTCPAARRHRGRRDLATPPLFGGVAGFTSVDRRTRVLRASRYRRTSPPGLRSRRASGHTTPPATPRPGSRSRHGAPVSNSRPRPRQAGHQTP
jgi:hypothetical protein